MSRILDASQSEAIRPIHRIFHTSRSDVIRLGRRIGSGAEGEVYEIQDQIDLVAKVYHQPPPPEKAEKLVLLSSLGNERLFNLSAWPVTTLLDAPGGQVVGFVMKKISQAEEVHALHSPKSRLQKFPEASWAFLIYAAANIARAVGAIHENGLVIGDVNPKNILVTRKATVFLLDVDSFQVSADGKTYRCEGGFPEYTPPELQGVAFRDVDRRQEHDCFGLAVVIFQLLFMGRHPFSGRYLGAGEMPLERSIREYRFAYGADAEARKMRQPPGTLALDSMPPALVALFRRVFLTTNRPRARDWVEPLDGLAKALKKCDLHDGHYYYSELRECPWCGIESQARVRLFNFLFTGDGSRRGHFRLDEIWKEIASVEAPHTEQLQWDKILKPSAEVAAFAAVRNNRFILSLVFSAFAGLAIPRLVDGHPSIFLLILAGLIAYAIARAKAPLPENIRERQRLAREEAQRLQEQYDRESGDERWSAKRDELRIQMETYENLAQMRQARFQQLETEAKKYQLEEYLDQFKINDAEIKGVVLPIKTALLSHGVETAADVIEEVKQIPSVGRSQAERLLEWRRGLEQKFVFDPARGVPPETRVRIEREFEALRFRLETELIGGARHLSHLKQEIEANSMKLQPALAEARREMAQSEKDLEVAGKHGFETVILMALIIMFIIGLAIKPPINPSPLRGADSGPGRGAPADQDATEKAFLLCLDGMRLSGEGKLEEAVAAFREAAKIDPKREQAHRELGHLLYRLKRYEESVVESEKAIELLRGFDSYYNLGLAYMELKRWDNAKMAFDTATKYNGIYSKIDWDERYALAYYYLARSQAQLGEAEKMIEMMEKEGLEDLWRRGGISTPSSIYGRLYFGSLYLWVGKPGAARAQYEILKNIESNLAEELLKLIEKHGKSA